VADLPSLQDRTLRLLQRPPQTGAQLLAAAPDQRVDRFSVFKPGHQERALALAAEFMAIAGENPGPDELERVLDRAAAAYNEHQVELVKYALMVFITHHPRGYQLPIPSLEMRDPDKARQSPATLGLGAGLLADAPTETDLNWFREDPLANEHHERWHVVYPARGVPPTGGGTPHTKQRQGELFEYMHQQMLARYDAERVAVGLPLVAPFDNYRSKPGFPYDPGPQLSKYYDPRTDGVWSDMNGYTIAVQETLRDQLKSAIANGKFPNTPPGVNNLGAAIEASVDGDPAFKPAQGAGLHNMGHVFFSAVGATNNGGVMQDTATAIRDPVFFRWHRHIDDQYYAWQERQTPYDFTADAPPVRIRKGATANKSPDIIICLKENIPGSGGQNFDFAQFGRTSFGGANWDKEPGSVLPVDTLITQMLDRGYDYNDPATGAVFHQQIRYLEQKEFVYYLRLENTSNAKQDVTVRIFLVPQKSAGERRMWIEMDKFRTTLQSGEKAVVFRPASESSVIRKPAKKPPEFLPIRRPGEHPGGDDTTYCDCGWPYNLLLPKGTPAGMGFRFLVMLTDWSKDHVAADSTCGSLSFCGAKQNYPDERTMGYPFDRPFKNGGKDVAPTVAAQNNMATRDIIIKAT
jgi:tyrosinase